MKFRSERILTTHAGALPQPDDLKQMHSDRDSGRPHDEAAFAKRVRDAVAEVIKKQLDCGLDIINDGEVGKSNFSRYARQRLSGFTEREAKPSDKVSSIFARDMVEFGDYFRKRMGGMRGENVKRVFCNGPLRYIGHASLKAEVDDFKAGLEAGATKRPFFRPLLPEPSSTG